MRDSQATTPVLFIPFFFLLLASAQGVLQPVKKCPALNKYYVQTLLPFVGPFGAIDGNAFIRGRYRDFDELLNATTPGGPAGLRPAVSGVVARRVKFSNISQNWRDAYSANDAPEDGDGGLPFSGTNSQIADVDEPDIVKTDGKRLYSITKYTFSVLRIDHMGKAATRVGQLELPLLTRAMFLYKAWAIVIAYEDDYKRPVYNRYINDKKQHMGTTIYQIDVTNPKPRLVSTLQLEGRYVQLRLVKQSLRIVMRFSPLAAVDMWRPGRGISQALSERWNKEIVMNSNPANWLPTYRLQFGKGVRTGVYTLCEEVFVDPDRFERFDLVSVVAIDVDSLLMPKPAAGIVSGIDTVFGSADHIVFATDERLVDEAITEPSKEDFKTTIHKFAVDDAGVTLEASGDVSGKLLNQFAIAVRNRVLFVATTVGASGSETSRADRESKIVAFRTNARRRRLVRVGEVSGFGNTEVIAGIRYAGRRAYVVTYRTSDPLYVVDLTDVRKMKVVGEVKVPGFSTYLHVIGETRVIGVGMETTEAGRPTGAKASLFDVSDATKPVELSKWTMDGSFSAIKRDHLAFQYAHRERVMIMPIGTISGEVFSGAVVFDVREDELREVGRIVHRDWKERRTWSVLKSLVLGGNVWSVSQKFVQINAVGDVDRVEDKVRID